MFCIKCGNEMTDDMLFCQKCGTKRSAEESNPQAPEAISTAGTSVTAKPRNGMSIWMTVFFVFAGFFALGCVATADISMLAGVFLFGIPGVMFLVFSKTPKEEKKVFASEKSKGISKGAFTALCIFLSFFMFVVFVNMSTSDTETQPASNSDTIVVEQDAKAPEKKEEPKQPEIPTEFAGACPVSVSASMYDNIIGFPELSCSIKNSTSKQIAAVQLYFVPRDVYGEEISGVFATNKLQSDNPIGANRTETLTWQMLEQEIKSGELYIYSVYFSDGTEWGDRSASRSKIEKYGLKLQVSY